MPIRLQTVVSVRQSHLQHLAPVRCKAHAFCLFVPSILGTSLHRSVCVCALARVAQTKGHTGVFLFV